MDLFLAVCNGRTDVVSKLIIAGSDPGDTDDGDSTALMYASMYGHVEIARILIRTGKSRPGHVNKTGATALIYASSNGITEIVRLLFSTGESMPWHADHTGTTALIYATVYGNENIARDLLATGESRPGHTDNLGTTALIFASIFERFEIARVLLITGESKVDHMDNHKMTALKYASDDVRRVILHYIVLGVIKRRREILFSVTRYWSKITDVGKPGSNQFFFDMGKALGNTSFEDLSNDYQCITEQNYKFFLEGCKQNSCGFFFRSFENGQAQANE